MQKTIRAIALILAVAMLAIPVCAESFTPSVTQKPAPEVVPVKDSKGNEVAGIVVDAEGKEVEGISKEWLDVIPVSESEDADPVIKEALEKAYHQIAEAKDLTRVAPKLEDALAEINKDLEKDKKEAIKAEDLVVRDLVYVAMSTGLEKQVNAGNKIAVKFDLKIQEGETLIVMQFIDGEWVIIYGEEIEIDEEGNAIVNLIGPGPVAFIVK